MAACAFWELVVMSMPNELAGVDFSRYKEWPVVRTPSGGIYYAVPNSAFVYDPFLSQAKGKPVLYRNPTPDLEAQQQAEDERQAQLDLQKQQGSPLNQILPVAAGTAGVVGGKYAIDAMTGPTAVQSLGNGTTLMSDGSVVSQATGQVVSQAAAPTAASAFMGGVSGVGPVASGSEYASMLGSSGAAPEIVSATRVPAAEAAGAGVGPYIGAAGIPIAGYGVYEGIKHQNPAQGGLAGAGLGLSLGAAAPLLGLSTGPLGWGALGLMALGGAGLGAGGAFLAGMFDRDMWKTEGKRLNKLVDDGVNIPDELMGATQLTKGRSKQELVNLEQSKVDQGMYGNPTFAQSRKESDLNPQDIWGTAAMFEKFGNDWLGKFSEQDRLNIAQKALDAGAVREHHGTIDIDWNKVNLDTTSSQATPAGGGTQLTPAAGEAAKPSGNIDPGRTPAEVHSSPPPANRNSQLGQMLARRQNERDRVRA